jgi:hypothetical protein
LTEFLFAQILLQLLNLGQYRFEIKRFEALAVERSRGAITITITSRTIGPSRVMIQNQTIRHLRMTENLPNYSPIPMMNSMNGLNHLLDLTGPRRMNEGEELGQLFERLSLGVNFTNILSTAFSYKTFMSSFIVLTF